MHGLVNGCFLLKAAQFAKYGGPEVIEINRKVATPRLRKEQILVDCYAASINPVDSFVRAGYLQKIVPLALPATTAGDFAGEVKQIGEGARDMKEGDKVFGYAPVFAGGSGSAAELVAASSLMIYHKPARVTIFKAAALPLAGVSALQAIEQEIKPTAGMKILIHGGAGGIGTFAIQMAKHHGSYVATTVRGSQKEFVANLGADKIIDFEKEEHFEHELKDFDAVLDNVGGVVYKRSFEVLKKGGVVVSMAENPPNLNLASEHGVRAVALNANVNKASLSRLADLVEKEILRLRRQRISLGSGSRSLHVFRKRSSEGQSDH